MIDSIKKLVQKYSFIFSILRFVPFSIRLGKDYSQHKTLINKYNHLNKSLKKLFHLKKMQRIVAYAYEHNEFYKHHYDENDFHPSELKKFDDIQKIPIVTKKDLKKVQFKERTSNVNSPFKVNTGGTSGEPLDFFLDKKAFSREWAYMHTIWKKLNYSYLDLKLTFRGKDNKGTALKYNVIHNEYIVDAYVSYDSIIESILEISQRKKIKYIHGYPSSIYSFCKYLDENNINPKSLFNENLRGVFFGSEFPAPMYRELIEKVLNVPTVSWYGHSEMAILAYEKMEKYRYFPFQTYGFTETVSVDEQNDKLIGTSYYNFNSPFIRYDTGDLVSENVYEDDILKSFKISSGRIGDIVLDKNDNPISLTALIFGRHHAAFNIIDFLQIKQLSSGSAILYVTTKNQVTIDLFDLKNVDIDFSIEIIPKPIKTSAGKVPLLIK